MIHVSISIACFNNVEVTKKCIEHLLKNTPSEGVEYIFTDNASTDGTLKFLKECRLKNKVVVKYAENHGFQVAHNEALELARGRFFIVLNNDIYMKSPNWLETLLDPLLQEDNVAIVGLVGNPSTLRHNGDGMWGEQLEYVDGSCLAGRTEQFRKHGLFSRALEMFYYEDSDMSLRYKQMGYELKLVKTEFEHFRGSSMKRVDSRWVQAIRAKNYEVFKSRWANYLVNRKFTNTVYLKARSDGIGDVLAITPVVKAIRFDHPTAVITIDTNFPEIFEKNPNVDVVINNMKEYPKEPFDRQLDLLPPAKSGSKFNYASYCLIQKSSAEVCYTKTFSFKPEVYLSKQELDYGAKVVTEAKSLSETGLVACLNLFSKHTFWEGRSWSLPEAKRLVKLLRMSGCATIELGTNRQTTEEADIDLVDKTTIREFLSVLANLQDDSSFLVCIDSLALHAAQAFGITAYALFGATEPVSRVVDFTSTYVVRNTEYRCLGCYQRKGVPNYNKCERSTQGCMMDLTAEYVMNYINGTENPVASNMEYLQDLARKCYEA